MSNAFSLTLPYHVVDVFTTRALEGNPLAVFPACGGVEGLTDSLMQRIARELNLSETVFVFPADRPEFAARLQIFTPAREVPFAGHPTIGTSFVLRATGIVPRDAERFVLEEKVGPVPVEIENASQLIWLTTPPTEAGPRLNRLECAAALGLEPGELLDIEPQLLSAGNPTLFIAVRDKAAVDRAALSGDAKAAYCTFVFAPVAEGAYSRMFAPSYGIPEDPATGSSTGPLALYMMRHGLAPAADGTRFISEQGVKMGRRSVLHVRIQGESGVGGIGVGGHVTPVAEATMRLESWR
jgi:trans-2,3-dihydro-3-hydroxyanthranilate isomerase